MSDQMTFEAAFENLGTAIHNTTRYPGRTKDIRWLYEQAHAAYRRENQPETPQGRVERLWRKLFGRSEYQNGRGKWTLNS